MTRNLLFGCMVSVLVLTGCGSSSSDPFSDLVDGLHAKSSPLRSGSPRSQNISTRGMEAGFAGAKHVGTGAFAARGQPTEVIARPASDGKGYELNLVKAPIVKAAKAVLRVPYVVVTLQASAAVSREALVDVFEAALSVNYGWHRAAWRELWRCAYRDMKSAH